jgi:predicted dehydrogenase
METKTNSQTLSGGVIGAGGMGTRHALNLHRAVGRARVAAVYDLDQKRARQVAGMCGQALIFDDLALSAQEKCWVGVDEIQAKE